MTTIKIESRNEQFTQKVSTAITKEVAADDNPFLVKEMRIHGYELFELMQKRSYTDMFYLMYIGELPDKRQKALFDTLAMALLNLGPRHVATRAAMNAAVGRTATSHVVPIANAVMTGDYNGAEEVESVMRFLRNNKDNKPQDVAAQLSEKLKQNMPEKGDVLLCDGFGSDFGGQSPLLLKLADILAGHAESDGYFHWAKAFVDAIDIDDCGWRLAGVVGAALMELGFNYRQGGGVLQVLCAPGAFAHGVDFASRPITDIPFIGDQDYMQGILKRENENEQ